MRPIFFVLNVFSKELTHWSFVFCFCFFTTPVWFVLLTISPKQPSSRSTLNQMAKSSSLFSFYLIYSRISHSYSNLFKIHFFHLTSWIVFFLVLLIPLWFLLLSILCWLLVNVFPSRVLQLLPEPFYLLFLTFSIWVLSCQPMSLMPSKCQELLLL